MPYNLKRGVARYSVAIGIALIATLLTIALAPYLAREVLIVFWPAVIFTAWYAGFFPAVLVSVLGVLAVDYFLIPPLRSLSPGDPADLVPMALFVGISAVVSSLTVSLDEARRRAEAAATDLADRARLLEEQAIELEAQRDEAQSLTEELEETVDSLERANEEIAAATVERERLAAIVDSSEDAIVGKTLDGIVTSWNDAAERMFGFSADEMIGRSIRTIVPPDLQSEEDE